uniref:Prohormone-2 n=1 Tax=Caenorhabditis tropicalis TaxID=1561998 RepID=A0A1I7TBZ0_9PELO
MWGKTPAALLLILYLGTVCALPIADVRASFNFNLPLRIPSATFVTNRSQAETLSDVARILNTSKSPFRYGKRSAPADVLEPPNKPVGNMYSARGSPFLSNMTPGNRVPTGYYQLYHNRNAERRSLSSVPGFTKDSFATLLDLLMQRKLLQNANGKCESNDELVNLDKLLDIVEDMENQQKVAPLEKTADARDWLNGITVAQKNAFEGDGFRRGNRSSTAGYN